MRVANETMRVASETTRIAGSAEQRAARRPMALPGRLTWKDARGTIRFASVITRNVSETGVFIEWSESTAIPLYRLVQFQLERDTRGCDRLPPALRSAHVLCAVFRQAAFRKSTGTPEGYGLRFLVEPAVVAHTSLEPVAATA